MNLDVSEALPALMDLIQTHLERERTEPVRPPQEPEALRAAIDLSLGDARPFGDVVEQLHDVLAATPSTASPRFFNQLFAGRDGAAFVGDVLASLLNNSMYTYKVAGVHVLMELELVRRMGELMGFTAPEGIFTPGGSLSNLAGMLIARNEAISTMKERGADGRTLRVYTSECGHYSVPKAAGFLAIGRDNVVKIPADGQGRMDPVALAEAITADLAQGFVPMMINATAGTTVQGAFDPLDAIADVAEAHGIWLHVDAAYGGSLIFHPDYQARFAGAARADSITWDAHKMMGVPLTCSVVLVRQRGLLTKHLSETATYLFQDDSDDLNPGTRSLQCGRRNDTLKLWTAWRTHGDAGYRRRMEALLALTHHARDRVLAEAELELVREPESLNLCFAVTDVDAAELCATLNHEGRAVVGFAVVDGHRVMRVVFLDPSVQLSDIDVFFEELLVVARAIRLPQAS